MVLPPEPLPNQSVDPSRPLWIVRGAAVASVLLPCVPFPPWEWPGNPAGLSLILPLGVLFLAILWRLRQPPYKGGLALAAAVGGSLVCLAGLAAFVSLEESSADRHWVAFLAVFAGVQAILSGSAIATYRHLGYARGDWTVFAASSTPQVSPADHAVLTKGIWAVRGAAIATILLACVPVPPWRWLEEPTVLFLILPPLAPFLQLLWRLRSAPRKEGLALGAATGSILFLGAGSLLFATSMSGSSHWGTLLWLVLLASAQVILAGGAIVTFRRLGYAKGDWKLFARSVVDALVFFAVMVFFFVAGIQHFKK